MKMGSQVTIASKSGGNATHGSIFEYFRNSALDARNFFARGTDPKPPLRRNQFGASLGGPILQDKMHFFVTYEGKRYSQPVAVTYANTPPAAIIAALPASVQSQVGPSSIPFTEKLVFGKLDYEPTDSDRLELSLKTRQEDSAGNGAGPGAGPSAGQ